MSRTLSTLITQCRTLISQTDSTNSDFTDNELTNFINEAVEVCAEQVEWPRSIFHTQAVQGTAQYTLPTDAIKLLLVFFGDLTISKDVFQLPGLEINQLTGYNEQWLDQSTQSQGTPLYCSLYNRTTLLINPTPDATNSATGKQIHGLYVQYPATLVLTTDVPNLPDIFHDQLKFYVGYLCYMGKLKNAAMGKSLFDNFYSVLKQLRPQVENQFDEKFFSWSNYGEGRMPSLANLNLI